MPDAPPDRNLLFGILALQMDFITRDALVAAMNAWVLDKAKSLGQILQEQGTLRADNRALLEPLVQRHLEMHGHDPRQSLAALPNAAGVVTPLGAVADADVQASLAHLAPATPTNAGEVTGPLVTSPLPADARFRILRPHARGGLGEVFVARDTELHREVALKEIQQRHADSADSRARFLLEAQVTGSLEHPGIVPVYGLGAYADGRPYYAMRFIRGDSLKDAIDRFHADTSATASGRSLALRELLGRFVAVCNAVAYAHSRGVLHRDLKPANVMLGKYGETLVVDWGLAKVMDQADAEATEDPLRTAADGTATQTGAVLGTPSFMSPEQAAGRMKELGPSTDVYSLGATLYALLTGQAPVSGQAVEVLARIQHGDFPKPRSVRSTVPAALEAVVLKAMALRPTERYTTARDLASDVERWLADEPTRAYREPWQQRLGRWVRRRQTTVAAVGALLLTASVALGISTVLIGQALRNEEKARGQEVEARTKEAAAHQEEEKARSARVGAQVEQLCTADAGAVPTILENLEPFRAEILPQLQARWADQEQPRQRRMRVGLALLASEPEAVREELFAWMLATEDPRELELTRNALEPHKALLRERLWSVVASQPAKSPVRFRALVALARFDPEDSRWPDAAPGVLETWLRADPIYFGVLTRALRPAGKHLLVPLVEVAKGHNKGLPEKRYEAASVLALYASEQTEPLVEVLLESDERQFGLLLPRVQARGEEALVVLQQELERPPAQTVAERNSQAIRQSNAGLALLRLGRAEAAWPLLKHSADPTGRTNLTLRLASRGVEARLLVERLEQTPEVSERRALLSALGEYDGEQLPADLRARLMPRLLEWYRDDPDPGIHGAIDWLLRQGQEGPVARKLDWGQAEELTAIDGSLACSYRRRPLERENGPEGRRWSVNGKGMTLVHFPGPVEFQMGSPQSGADREINEIPHRRRIERSFAVANRKVTVRDFMAFRKAHPPTEVFHEYEKKYSPEPECPITVITWWDAAQYCRWLSEEEGFPEGEMVYPSVEELEKCKKDSTKALKLPVGHLLRKGYRLPTEAEWEYACRAGATTAHYYGDGGEDLLAVYAWYLKNARDQTWPVGQKRPNDFGLFDMHGNTWDWCQESGWKYAVPASGLIVDEEDKRDIKDGLGRALRGGSFVNPASGVRSACRSNFRPSNRLYIYGLRVARTL